MKITRKLVVSILLVAIILSMVPLTALASRTVAWGAANVNGNGVRIRSGPGLSHDILTHVNQDDIVVILERTNSEWHKVNFHGTVGFISVPLLTRHREAANFRAGGRITGNMVNMRAEPNTSSASLGQHNTGTIMTIIGINNGWYKVEHGSNTGYVRSDLMDKVSQSEASSQQQSASSSASRPGQTAPTSAPPAANRTLGQQIADYAVSYVGTRYIRGGAGPGGFDCSGLVTYVLREHGIRVTRNASGQYRDNGTHISRADLVPGDLVFFSNNGQSVSHVGIYIGNDRFVHASSSRTGVIISVLSNRTLFGAKRVAT